MKDNKKMTFFKQADIRWCVADTIAVDLITRTNATF
jgi:hypothetical protein